MKNWRLSVGMICVGILFIVALFGPELAPYPKNYSQMIAFVQTSHGRELRSAPFPPSAAHWFGTNRIGRDMLTLLLYGAKFTIFTAISVAVLRVVIGAGAGIWSGILSKKGRSRNASFGMMGSIPSFLIIYFVMLGISINTPLTPFAHTVIEGSLLTFVGIPGVFGVIRAKTVEMRKNLYIEAAISLGGSPFHLFRKHFLPTVKGNLLILFVNEVISVLSLIGQLGIFHIFLGGTNYRPLAIFIKYRSISHEWAGMVGQFRDNLFNNQWVVVFPICAMMFAILSFYLVSSGLEQREKRSYHKFPHI